jgi:plasmid stabilization system protein ParE
MPSAKLSAEARQDLKEIAKYIGRLNRRPITAEQVIRAIKSKCKYYAEHPSAAQMAPELGAETRLGIQQRWVIIYEPIITGIHVLRIVDGARDYPNLFSTD